MKRTTTIAILGASGYLGSSAVRYFRKQGCVVLDDTINVLDSRALGDFFKTKKPDAVINLTGPRAYPTIDWCEDHKKETVQMLVSAPINVALAAEKHGVYPIQIMSGCIYLGGIEYAFTEEDAPNFFGSFYSRMRIVGQQALAELPVLQARIRMPISSKPHPRNFIDKIASYEKVISIPNSVTIVEELWPALQKLMAMRPYGIVNMTNRGYALHSDILAAYKKYVDPNHSYTPITLDELEGKGGITRARRSNCVLSTDKARSWGVEMEPIERERLVKLMQEYARFKHITP